MSYNDFPSGSYDNWKLDTPPSYIDDDVIYYCDYCDTEVDSEGLSDNDIICDGCRETMFCDYCSEKLDEEKNEIEGEVLCDNCFTEYMSEVN